MSKDKFLHLELTSRCSLKCHACPRTQWLNTLHVSEMPIASIDSILPLLSTYSYILLCGNHGDPIFHSQFHKILETFTKSSPQTKIVICTSGSGRDEAWWQQTARLLREDDEIHFGVDGLPANFHRYRVNAKWESINNAVKTLTQLPASPLLIWNWILFNYNTADIEKGISLARELGFYRIDFIFSPRHKDDRFEFQLSEQKNSIIERIKNAHLSEM